MTKLSATEIDKYYILLNEINAQQNASQRDLSHKTGLSLGTVNLLLQKMIRDGLVKIETIPARRVIYMLTPKGLAEKAFKTVNYIRSHYRIIKETKNQIHLQLEIYHSQYDKILLILPGNELDVMLVDIFDEYRAEYPNRLIQTIDACNLPLSQQSISERSIMLFISLNGHPDQSNLPDNMTIPLASLLDVSI